MQPTNCVQAHVEERIISIIQRKVDNSEKSKIAQLMVTGTNDTIDDALEILKGIDENRTQ